MRLLIAARQSDLARLQARRVGAELKRAHPQLHIQYHFRESLGDRDQVNPLSEMPAKGVFTEDFVKGLEDGEFDLVVHSWKDLPTEPRANTEIVATLSRADARDVLLVHKRSFEKTDSAWRVLSSSPRRQYFLGQSWRRLAPAGAPDLQFQTVRGNIPTRLLKLQRGEGDALLVAKAALDRLLESPEDEFASARSTIRGVLDACQWMVLPLSLQPPAPAQGALAIEIRRDRADLRELLKAVEASDIFADVTWEREQLSRFGGGCHLKLGAMALTRQGLRLRILRGEPPGQPAVNELWVERKAAAPAAAARDGFFAPHSEDFFEIETRTARLHGDAFYVAHRRALPADLPENCRLWTAGLKTWQELARRGYWITGSDESWGESRPDVDALAGRRLNWTKLTHAGVTGTAGLPAIATYALRPRPAVKEPVLHALTNSRFFFWRSGTLFEHAWNLIPGLKTAHHSCGPGATRGALEKKLGPLSESQVFLDEAEWRMFYGRSL